MTDLKILSPCERHGCAACCYDTEMPLTESDIKRLEALGHAAGRKAEDPAGPAGPAWDRAAFVAWSPEGTAQLATVEPADGMPGRPCYFLKDNRCSVYASRPDGCRIYPLVLNEREKLVRDEDCPHRAEFPLDPTAKRRIQRVLSNLARRF